MAQINRPSDPDNFQAGQPIIADDVNADFNTIYLEFNGGIDNTNIKVGAGIEDDRLDQIKTANKVAANTALTGLIPSANQDSITSLIEASPIVTDASAATIFTVTLTQNRTLKNPDNPVAGMKRIWQFTQDATGGWVLTLDTDFRVADVINGGILTIPTAPNAVCYIGALYNGTKWDVLAFSGNML
jgi:hypothetical protein